VEVPAGGDARFGEDLAKVPFDGVGADEKFRGNLGVGASVSGQPDDVLLLRGELAVGADLAFADLLAGGDQFPTPVRDGNDAAQARVMITALNRPPAGRVAIVTGGSAALAG
jgi:hypothetical protein